jgi:hypothetical protein
MERFCVQPIKVPFETTVYPGSELLMNLPKLGDAIGTIRLVLDQPNIFLEEIIQEAELIGIEKLWGEFIRIENDLKLSIEKAPYRSSTIIPIPFHCLTDFYFDPLVLRILFLGATGGPEIKGHFLIDYATTGGVPKSPFFKKTRHVSMIKAPMNNSKKLTLDVYIPGSVYEIFFTVRDTQGNFVQCIENVKLIVDDRERFNCTGDHLHYIEPLKRYGSYASNIYMYSFSLMADETRVPSGQTCLSEKQRFIIDTFPQSGTLTIWACSHNFVYNNKRVFESYELALQYTQDPGTRVPAPVRSSSITSNGKLTVLYSSNVSLSSPNGQYQVLPASGSLTFSSNGYTDTTCSYNLRTDWLGPPQLYDMFYTGNPYLLIDGNNRLFIKEVPFVTDQYSNFFSIVLGNLYKYDPFGNLLYIISQPSCFPGFYFGFDAIPLLSGMIQTTNGTITTSFVTDSIIVDSSNVYVVSRNTYCVYDQLQLKLQGNVTLPYVTTSQSLIGLTRKGPVICLSTGDVFQFDFNFKKVWRVTTSPGGTLNRLIISEYDDVFISYVSENDFYVYKVGTGYFKHYYGADSYDISFSGSIFLVKFSAIYDSVTVTEQVLHEYGKTIPQGQTCFVQLDINLQYNSSDTIVHYNTPLDIYESPKYDGTYFNATITGQEISFSNTYLWNNYVVCNISVTNKFSLSCNASGTILYSAINTDSTSSLIYGTHGVSSISVPATIGFSATLISMDTFTSNIQWVAVIDGMSSESIQSVFASSSNVYMCGSYGPQSSNVYNSDNTLSIVLPSIPQIGGYLTKYSSSGAVLWATYCSSINNPIVMSSVSHMNTITTCFISKKPSTVADTINIYNSSFISSCVFTVSQNFGCLVQYDYFGNYIKSIYFENTWIDDGTVLSINSNTYCSFTKGSDRLVIDGSTTFPWTFGGLYNAHCIVKFNPSLVSYAGVMITTIDLVYNGGISVDLNDNLYAAGKAQGYLSVYDTSGTEIVIGQPTSTYYYSYLAKFNSNGRYSWMAFFYSTSNSMTNNFKQTAASFDGTSVFAAGLFDAIHGTNIILNGNNTQGVPIVVTPTSSISDAILVKFSSGIGVSQWYVTVTGIGLDSAGAVTTDMNGYVYLSGYYTGGKAIIRDGLGSVYNTYTPLTQSTQVAFNIKLNGLNGSLVTVS